MKLPIKTVSLPADLKGKNNGKIDKALLKAIPGGQLHHLAAAAWKSLLVAATKAGVDLKPTSPVDTYRPYEVQLRIFKERYDTTKRLSKPRTFEGKLHWLKPGKAAAAVPGTSNHGWGLAIDVANINQTKLEWLVANAGAFGFSWELQDEPWHLRYVAGDQIPSAVITQAAPKVTVVKTAKATAKPVKKTTTKKKAK